MAISLLPRPQFELINRRTLRYPLAAAEKDYFLALALLALYASPLKESLVFKGGTALHHCYLPQQRFSEDLDFTALRADLTAAEVEAVLQASGLFTVKKSYESVATIKLERVRYSGLLASGGSLKVEIDHVQNVVLPAQPLAYRNVWHVPVTVQAMDIREICAEKIRATSQRARYRDFYDLYLIFTTFAFNLAEIIALLRQKELRKPIRYPAMLTNWQVAQEQSADELKNIYCAQPISNEAITAMLAGLTFPDIDGSA